jgi:hypothetical protein
MIAAWLLLVGPALTFGAQLAASQTPVQTQPKSLALLIRSRLGQAGYVVEDDVLVRLPQEAFSVTVSPFTRAAFVFSIWVGQSRPQAVRLARGSSCAHDFQCRQIVERNVIYSAVPDDGSITVPSQRFQRIVNVATGQRSKTHTQGH